MVRVQDILSDRHGGEPMAVAKDKHAWVRSALMDKGLQQKDVAAKWECDAAVVSRFIKTGEPPLTFDRAVSLAEMLGMTIDELRLRIQEDLGPRRAPPKPIASAIEFPAADGDRTKAALEMLEAAAATVRRLLPGATVKVSITYDKGE